jgi:hypothetical protein
LWELILKIGIVGTYLRIGIVALIFRNYGTLPKIMVHMAHNYVPQFTAILPWIKIMVHMASDDSSVKNFIYQ